MALVVRNTVTDEILGTFDKRKDAAAFVKAAETFDNAKARLNYWDRKEFPTAEILSR